MSSLGKGRSPTSMNFHQIYKERCATSGIRPLPHARDRAAHPNVIGTQSWAEGPFWTCSVTRAPGAPREAAQWDVDGQYSGQTRGHGPLHAEKATLLTY